MNFSNIGNMIEKNKNFFMDKDSLVSNINKKALEAQSRVVNVDDTPMQVKVINDKMIDFNDLKAIDNPIMFERGRVPTVGGLFSEYIFGTTAEERMRTFGYIDLKREFIHPYIYEIIRKMFRNIDKIASGEGSWYIESTGEIIEIKDENDPRYDEDATGLQWFIDNYDKIKFAKNDSMGRNDIITLIDNLKREDIFISKWLVVPVFYRDVDMSIGRPSIPTLNYDYNNLIKFSNMLSNDDFSYFSNKTMFNIQMALIKIRKYGQSLIEKKKGAFHQSILGKSIDYGARSVISVPVMNDIELPEESPVDIIHTGVPLSQCCVLGYPFMIKWILDFFKREFDDVTKKTIYYKNPKTGEVFIDEIEIEDQMGIFTKAFIDKKMKAFINTYGERYETVKIKLKDGKEAEMLFTGRGMSRQKDDVYSATISNRPMTWTDIFYMAAEQTLSDKYVYTTRYPLTDYFGIFPSKCRPLSTIRTTPTVINGEIYPFYPSIDLSLSETEISTNFIDTVELSNLYLKAIGGDYDGDQVSVKMCYSLEANKEAEEIMNSLKHFISIQGDIVRIIENESYLTFYNMTRY